MNWKDACKLDRYGTAYRKSKCGVITKYFCRTSDGLAIVRIYRGTELLSKKVANIEELEGYNDWGVWS